MSRSGVNMAIMALSAVILFHTRSAVSETLRSSECVETIEAKVVRKLDLPSGYHEGLFFDGKNIWLANGECGKIWIIDIATGGISRTLNPVGPFTEGIAKSGDSYFITDWETKKIYRARLEDDNFVSESEASLEPAHVAGVVLAGNRLFVVTWTRGFGTRFDLVELDGNFKVLRTFRIQRIQEPSQMAWDGKYLWISSWYSRLVYRVDIDIMEITGCFHSPVSLTTGIVWDGKYMWLTGTYGDLYQLEIS